MLFDASGHNCFPLFLKLKSEQLNANFINILIMQPGQQTWETIYNLHSFLWGGLSNAFSWDATLKL